MEWRRGTIVEYERAQVEPTPIQISKPLVVEMPILGVCCALEADPQDRRLRARPGTPLIRLLRIS